MDARFVYTVQNTYLLDATMQAKVAAVDLVPCVQEKHASGDVNAICSDSTVIAAPGVITRTIIVSLPADFATRYPTAQQQQDALRNLFKNRLEMMLPGPCSEAAIVFGALCP